MTPIIPCVWNGEAFSPSGSWATSEANGSFVCGQRYCLAVQEQRSEISHRHEFAWLAEAWRNLPETLADSYPTPEHLRKRALIDAGYFDEMIVDAGTNAAALRVASAFRSLDDFALVIVRGPAVVRRTAKSQSRRAMGVREFQASKTALMDTVAAMIGVSPEDLRQNTARAA